MDTPIIKTLILVMVLLLLLSSCYYDKYDEMLITDPNCITTNMTYTTNVKPIMTQNCTSCHSGSAPSAGIALENYEQVKAAAQNGSLTGVINQTSGWSPMPKNQAKLSDCSISQIEAWIAQGLPN
jgi:uncharacterized membrane protein